MQGFTIKDRGDGTAEIYDNGLLISTIERDERQSMLGHATQSAGVKYVARGVRYSDEPEHGIRGSNIYIAVASGSSTKVEQLTPWVRARCIDIVAQTWAGTDQVEKAAELRVEQYQHLGIEADPEPSRDETTLRLTVSLKAANGFDTDHVTDPDYEPDEAESLADHIAAHVHAAVDGLVDSSERTLGLKYVVLADVIPGDV